MPSEKFTAMNERCPDPVVDEIARLVAMALPAVAAPTLETATTSHHLGDVDLLG
jgi:hypothetical protein